MLAILQSFIASVIYAVIGALCYRFIYIPLKLNYNALVQALPFSKGKNIINICYGLIPPNENIPYHTIEEGDFSAVSLAERTLAKYYGQKKVKTYSAFALEGRLHEETNVLTISGPRWNPITAKILGGIGSPLYFDKITDSIILKNKDNKEEKYTCAKSEDGKIEICYGIIVAGKFVTSELKQQNVVICAGINNISTYGAVVFLMGLKNKKVSINSLIEKNSQTNSYDQRVAILIKITNVASVSEAALNPPLDPTHVNVEIIKILKTSSFIEPYICRY